METGGILCSDKSIFKPQGNSYTEISCGIRKSTWHTNEIYLPPHLARVFIQWITQRITLHVVCYLTSLVC